MSRDLTMGDTGTIDALSTAYNVWLNEQGIPEELHLSADELEMEDITPAQKEWLAAFINLWNLTL